jgi:hypothetical protein
MSLEIPDIKEFEPELPTPVSASKCHKCDCSDSTVVYQKMKEQVVTAMEGFKDQTKNMVHIALTDFPSTNLINELQAKNYNVKYELAYDGKTIFGNLRVYRPGYAPSNMSEAFDVFSTAIPIDSQTSEKFKNVMEKFMQF